MLVKPTIVSTAKTIRTIVTSMLKCWLMPAATPASIRPLMGRRIGRSGGLVGLSLAAVSPSAGGSSVLGCSVKLLMPSTLPDWSRRHYRVSPRFNPDASASMRVAAPASRWVLAVLAADNKTHACPGAIDGAHLVVHQPSGQCDVANDVIGHVRRQPGRALGKRDPQPAGRGHPGPQPRQLGLQLGPLGDECHDHVVARVVDEVGMHARDIRQLAE